MVVWLKSGLECIMHSMMDTIPVSRLNKVGELGHKDDDETGTYGTYDQNSSR